MDQETPKDDPREKSDWKPTKQTDKPWEGVPEKEQFDPDRRKPDLEKWKQTDTH
jgi:hypothetical protein